MRNFVAQFGVHGDSAVNAMFMGKNIPDDTVRATNKRGTLSFARGGANTRSTQLFFNLVDNTPRLDTLNRFGFPPIGEVVRGVEVLDSLNWEYTGTRGGQTFPGPSQDSIRLKGNAYLRRAFPRLDYIVSARAERRSDLDALCVFSGDRYRHGTIDRLHARCGQPRRQTCRGEVAVANREVRLSESRQPIEPVPAFAGSVHPEDDRQTGATRR
jgi:cyclophilin family peptidyl-prolyl cis-trans isomerase